MFARILLIFLVIPAYSKQFKDDLDVKECSQVEIRAVFINCQIDEEHLRYGSEISRFQREEFFKHNALRDCKKKLALTVKMTSDSEHSSSDEYIPIEHVLDGSNRKRVRLLNPFILRLRREPPFETYKLRELETFSGLLTSSEKTYQTNRKMTNPQNRLRRNIHFTNKVDWIVSKHDKDDGRCARTKPVYNSNIQRTKHFHFDTRIQNNPFEETLQTPATHRKNRDAFNRNKNKVGCNMPFNINFEDKNVSDDLQLENVKNRLEGTEKIFHLYEVGDPNIFFKAQVQLLEKLSTPEGKTIWKDLTQQDSAHISSLCPEWTNQDVNIRYRCAEWVPKEDFTLSSTGICLLLPHNEKLNDEFSNDKLEDFIIVPFEDIEAIEDSRALKRSHGNSSISSASGIEGERHRRILVRLSRALFGRNEDNFIIINEDSGKYLRIPYRQPHRAQIELEAKADENQLVYVGFSVMVSELFSIYHYYFRVQNLPTDFEESGGSCRISIYQIPSTSMWCGGGMKKSSGRLTTIVSESTRRTRAVLTVQVTNTGLAAARLRPKIRECGPELLMLNEDEIESMAKPILISPLHTYKFRLEIPLEMPGDSTHCSVALLNDGDESIAVRDVRIKRGDRCFCVWHCQCVCLNEDPKLLCQEMAEYQQVGAGLAPRDRPRHIRAVCYPDAVTLNLLVIAFGVLVFLFILGLLKAFLGLFLRCVGSWGIDQLLQTPRKLDRYYERSLRCRTVVFDDDGWPVHPDTLKRTVRLISKPMEFVLNIIFFVTMPCLILWNSLKRIMLRCQNKESKGGCDSKTKHCCNPQDLQKKNENGTRWRVRRRRRHLSKWMSPQAEQLSTDIWRNGLAPQGYCASKCMRPLLREDRFKGNKLYKLHSPVVDSEQDDTEYVLMQMQNSRESLAKDQEKLKQSSNIN